MKWKNYIWILILKIFKNFPRFENFFFVKDPTDFLWSLGFREFFPNFAYSDSSEHADQKSQWAQSLKAVLSKLYVHE